MQRHWTPEEEDILSKMAKAGCNAFDILKVLKSRSINGITSKASTLGLSLAGGKPDIDMDAFKRLMGQKGR